MSLGIDHRPPDLESFIGNQLTVKSIAGLFENRRDKFPHAILITGNSGCGKTTLGRIISNMLGCMPSDYNEIDSAQFNGIDTVRDIRKKMRLKPTDPKSTCRVWLLDECHMLGQGGASEKNKTQNALLKALEDAPDHVYFILCTTDPQRLLKTVVGRCTPFTVAPLSEDEMNVLLKRVGRAEKVKLSNKIRETLYQQSFGQPRNALKLMEKIIGLDPDEMIVAIEEEAARQNAAIDLARALIKGAKWAAIAKILKGLKDQDEEGIRRMVYKYCASTLLNSENQHAMDVMDEFHEPFFTNGWNNLVLACYKASHII